MSNHDRQNLTFEQAEGAHPLPGQMQAKSVSQEQRAKLWAIFASRIQAATQDSYYKPVVGNLAKVLRDEWVHHRHRFIDDWSNRQHKLMADLRPIFEGGAYVELYGFIEYVIRHPDCPATIAPSVQAVLENTRAPYRLHGNTVIPFSSQEESQSLAVAVELLDANELSGARAHLLNAGAHLTAGRWADCIRESVHAVESVARILEPSAKTLDPALSKLEKAGRLHPALRGGFGKLYGFTSDEQGIRHALLDAGEAKVDEADAFYMLGACAAFVAYLVKRGRAANLLG